jgi:hypothetical protein
LNCFRFGAIDNLKRCFGDYAIGNSQTKGNGAIFLYGHSLKVHDHTRQPSLIHKCNRNAETAKEGLICRDL